MLDPVLSFALVAGLVTLTPGLDTALVLRTAATRSRKEAFAAASGICLGCLVWGLAAALGVSALLTASEAAFTIVKYLGMAYMLYLGGRMLWTAIRGEESHEDAEAPGRGGVGRYFRQGLVTNLLNPKVGAFYVALLPQFIPAGASPALMGTLLAGVHGLEGMAWSTLLILLVNTMSAWLQRPSVRRWIDAVAGVAVIGFGLKLGLSNA